MVVFKRRTRMVNFRLSEDEYKDLKNMCLAKGCRSVSDFARSAVCQVVNSVNGSSNGSIGKIESNVQELRGKFEELDREVKRMAQLLVHASVSQPATTASRVLAAATKPAGAYASASRPATVATNQPTEDRGGMRKGLSREKLCATLG